MTLASIGHFQHFLASFFYFDSNNFIFQKITMFNDQFEFYVLK